MVRFGLKIAHRVSGCDLATKVRAILATLIMRLAMARLFDCKGAGDLKRLASISGAHGMHIFCAGRCNTICHSV